jgi:hypothetical protein
MGTTCSCQPEAVVMQPTAAGSTGNKASCGCPDKHEVPGAIPGDMTSEYRYISGD